MGNTSLAFLLYFLCLRSHLGENVAVNVILAYVKIGFRHYYCVSEQAHRHNVRLIADFFDSSAIYSLLVIDRNFFATGDDDGNLAVRLIYSDLYHIASAVNITDSYLNIMLM